MEIEIRVNLGSTATLDRRLNAAIDRALHAGTDDATKLLRREMQVYPAQRAGSKYIRRHILEASWINPIVRRVSGGWSGVVASSGQIAPYNVHVQKAGVQAVVHRGRWPTEVQVTDRLRPHIVGMYQTRLDRAIAGMG